MKKCTNVFEGKEKEKHVQRKGKWKNKEISVDPLIFLTLSWRRPLSYRNQSIDLLNKSTDWFLYDNDLRHERVKVSIETFLKKLTLKVHFCFQWFSLTAFSTKKNKVISKTNCEWPSLLKKNVKLKTKDENERSLGFEREGILTIVVGLNKLPIQTAKRYFWVSPY